MPEIRESMSHGSHLQLATAPHAVPEELHIWMLGDFRVSVGPHIIERHDWRLRKAASLLKLLALQPRYRIHREQVMDLLWPGLDPKRAANNLH